MFSSLDVVRAQVAEEIQHKTSDILNELTTIWTKTFETPICEDNLKKLTEHVATFYNDILNETIQRRDKINEDIEKLREEASDLRRLLHVDISLTPEKDVPLYTLQRQLDENLKDLRETLEKRKSQIYDLLLEQETLCDELGESPKELLDDPLPTEDEIFQFRLHLDSLHSEKVNRLHQISTLRRDIKSFLAALEIELQSEEEQMLLNDRYIPLTRFTVNRLTDLRDQYSKQVEEVRESIQNMKKKLLKLWDCLETCPSIREKFASYTDFSQTTYDKFYRELNRCETQKKQNIKKFVDRLREEILIWWDKTLKCDVERSRFSNFTNDCYTEDLLALHEMELEDLKRYYYENERIFDLWTERKTLWDRMCALEAKASDPGRYNNRGGQLLKEEKERKTIANKLPKIESQLTELVFEYESDNNKQFLVFGEHILELIEKQWEEKRAQKEKHMSARKQGLTPLSKTISRTPLSAHNGIGVTSALRKLPGSKNISSIPLSGQKRKLQQSENVHPTAKRSLLTELNSPNPFLRPHAVSKTPKKSPLKKPRVIATTIKKKSGRVSGNNKRKSNVRKTPKNKLKVNPGLKKSAVSDSMSYDTFEEYIEKDPTSRSSMLEEDSNTKTRNQRKAAMLSQLTTNPRLMQSTSKLNYLDQPSVRKSPLLCRTGSPMAPSSSRKLTTKNLPIII